MFLPKNTTFQTIISHQGNVSEEEFLSPNESINSTTEDQDEHVTTSSQHESSPSSSPRGSEYDYEVTDSVPNSVPNDDSCWSSTPITIDLRKSNLEGNNDYKSCDGKLISKFVTVLIFTSSILL